MVRVGVSQTAEPVSHLKLRSEPACRDVVPSRAGGARQKANPMHRPTTSGSIVSFALLL